MTLKENRFWMWPLWIIQLIHRDNQDQTSIPYHPRKYKEIMLILSWGRIPLIWVSWISLKPYYEYVFVLGLVLGGFSFMVSVIFGFFVELEDATYGMFDQYCN